MENKPKVFTGYFADGVRRIDLVLVLRDDGNSQIEGITNTFLLNALKLGLEIEMEHGTMKRHRDLIFAKVHAPDSLIRQYAEIFSIQRHFKDSHVDFINAENSFMKYFKMIMPFFFNRREREWIKLVRNQYPNPKNYSTLERSQIVYRIFLALPFGNNENYVGLERLLKRNLIIDAYALHDGPYFFLPKQDVANVVNVRQILYTNWIGADALLKAQPLSLLQEYFGEKIAFYFAFCELFNRFLLLSCGAGIVMIYEAFKELNLKTALYKRRGVENTFCLNVGSYKNSYMCPNCRDFNICPFTRVTDHCKEVTLGFMLESPYMINYYIFIMIWGIIFIFVWKRREHYLSWLWESDCGSTSILRPDHKANFKTIKRSKVTGILKNYDSVFTKIFNIIKSLAVVFALLAVIFPMTLYWANLQFRIIHKVKAEIKDPNYAHFAGLAIFSLIYVFVNVVFEKIMEKLSYVIVSFENHKTQDSYEKSLIEKQFGSTFAFNFSYFIFLGFVKGRFYTFPYDIEMWNSIAGVGVMNCGVFTCVNEMCVLLIVNVLFKSIVFSGLSSLFRCRTDYNKTRTTNANVPCWEREYILNNISEQFYINQFKDLAIQFAMSVLFVGAFPLAPIIILIGNVLKMRYNSWYFLLGSRRPLLHDSLGIVNWRNIITAIAFASVISNVLMMVLNTRTAQAEFYEWFGYQYNTDWVSFHSTLFDVSDFTKNAIVAKAYKKYKGFKPKKCIFPGRKQMYKGKMTPLIYESRSKNTVMQKLILFQVTNILPLYWCRQ
ncbi:anoctamin-5 isoform X2 [Bombyx mori]|uniref:Anoctamin n=1 Tax=Bombyx mori TaxID=7091 RepID=A0A8R2QYN6_BOMMO|nr:anoctamin-5 isoform X2 [Bombyx mori]